MKHLTQRYQHINIPLEYYPCTFRCCGDTTVDFKPTILLWGNFPRVRSYIPVCTSCLNSSTFYRSWGNISYISFKSRILLQIFYLNNVTHESISRFWVFLFYRLLFRFARNLIKWRYRNSVYLFFVHFSVITKCTACHP